MSKRWRIRTHYEVISGDFGVTVIANTRKEAKEKRVKEYNSKPGAGQNYPMMSIRDLVASPVPEVQE